MKYFGIFGLAIGLFLGQDLNAQVFWTETFGTGCAAGTLADGFSTPNGTWSTSVIGTNGAQSNEWYISATESGEGVGNCGDGCLSTAVADRKTLHIGTNPVFGDFGAAYLAEGGGFFNVVTDKRAESPTIDCSNQCDITLSFEYIENGDGTLDNHTLWYFDGASWSLLADTPKTPLCGVQGQWQNFSISLPASANNNPNVRIGFRWVNNDDAIGTDPSIAIYNIQLSSNDVIPPTMDCVSGVNVYVTANECIAQVPDLILPPNVIVSDNCTATADIIVTQNIPSGTPIVGVENTITIEVTATDLAGNSNSCFIEVTSMDTIGPVLTCPSTQSVFADANCSATIDDYLPLVTAIDNCSPTAELILSQSLAAGSSIQNNTLIEITALDTIGNVSQCSFTVELIDTISPIVSCPSGITQSTALTSCDTLLLDYTSALTWSDNCSTLPTQIILSQSPLVGSVIQNGDVIELSATDEAGNTSSCQFTITVLDLVQPNVICPNDTVLYLDANCELSLPDFGTVVTAADNCDATLDLMLSQSPAIGTVLSGANAINTVTYQATDLSGNIGSCNFQLTLIDTIAPQLDCPASINVSANNDCEWIVTDLSADVLVDDNCTSASNFTFSQSINVGNILPVGLHNITFTATDESGNASSCLIELNVVDNDAPTIVTCPTSVSLLADVACSAILPDYVNLVDAIDNCTAANDLIWSQSPAVGSVVTNNITVEMEVTDANGNAAVCPITLTLIDDMAPVISCPNDTVVNIDANCNMVVPDVSGWIQANDNCTAIGDLVFNQVPAIGSVNQGQTSVDLVVLDEAGNSASCTIVLVPDDAIAPQITCPAPVSINIGTACEDVLQDYTALATVTDNCPGWIVEQSPAPGTTLLAGSHNVTITAIDIFGNTDACVLQVDLFENEAPEITCPDPIQTCDPIVVFDDPIATDNCAVVQLIQTDLSGLTSGDSFPLGITTLSFEAIDASGNAASCSFDVELLGVPEDAIILTQNTAFCEEFELNISAQPVSVAGAQWVVISGDGVVSDASNPSTNFSNLSYGLNAVVWEMDFGVCGRQADTLEVMVYEQPAPAQVFGPLTLCNETEVNISAAGPTAGQGEWSSLSGNVNFFLLNSPNTLAQDFDLGENVLIWEVTNGVCVPSADTLIVLNVPPALIASMDTTICFEENDIDLVAFWTDTNQVGYLWYFIEGGGAIDGAQSPVTFVENMNAGQNTIVLAHTHPNCQNTFDTLSVFVEVCDGYNPKIPTMFTPNNDGKNDLFIIEGLHSLFPSSEVTIVNRWGSVVFQSIGYEEPWDGTRMNGGEEMPVGTYFYRIRLNDGVSEEITGPISIVR